MSNTNDYFPEFDIFACRLILAYLEADPDVRALYVYAVGDECGLTPDAFELVNWTACRAATLCSLTGLCHARNILLKRLDALLAVQH